MKPRVYIETTVVSYYTARPSRDLVVAARQQITRDHWPRIQAEFECYISALVLQEIGQGDPQASRERLAAVSQIPVLRIDDAAEELAARLVKAGPLPRQHAEDALHIALAARNGMHYLLTWNLAHIHNAQMENDIRMVVERHGYQCPVICSPDELLGD
jgi:predicted nucleic acid-binding protein